MSAFWSSVMLSSGRYHGKPVQMHAKHLDVLTPAMFTRWLELWTQTTHALFAPEHAKVFVHKASQIATSLKFALFDSNTAR
jgi:hemoglobin